jgi:hypothetical protein
MERRAQFVLLNLGSQWICMEYEWDVNGMDHMIIYVCFKLVMRVT